MEKAHLRHRKRQWFLFWLAIAGFAVIVLLLWFRLMSVRSRAFEAAAGRVAPPVRVMEIEPAEVWKKVTFLGRVKGGQTIDVRADVGGWVVERRVERGEKVKKGAPLLVLEDERRDLDMKEALARLNSVKAGLKELERKLAQSGKLFEKGIVPLDTLNSYKNEVNAKRADVDALKAAYDRMKWDFEKLVVRASISGQVVEILPDIGQEVLRDEVVARMVNTANQRVVAGIDIKWARKISSGQPVDIVANMDGKERVIKGIVTGVSRNVDAASGTYVLEARIPDYENYLWPGEVVKLLVPVERLVDVVKVPRSAVLSDQDELFLFAYVDDMAKKVPVNVTWLDDKTGAVPAQELPSGVKVIVEGHAGLVDGERVRVAN